jgi:hypothetical protein
LPLVKCQHTGRLYKSLNNKHCVEVESGKRKPLLMP